MQKARSQKHLKTKNISIMKTLIITGTHRFLNSGKTEYTVDIFGQTAEHPKCVFIKQLNVEVVSLQELIRGCKKIYCDYFDTDDYNIITIDRC